VNASRNSRTRTRVPTSRLGRVFRIGMMASELALGSALDGARQWVSGRRPEASATLLSARNAQVLARELSRLRGAAMKLGQMLSLQGDEILPPEFAQALSILGSQAYAMPAAQLHGVLGREYGAGWQRRFASFDEEPIAAASIGQVHRARAKDGRELVLKIQYPGVARSIDSDVDNLATLLRWLDFLPLELDVAGLTAEAKRQLRLEADYEEEARHAERFRKLLGDSEEFVVPRVHRDLSTRRILALDFAAGVPLESLQDPGVAQRERDRVGRLLESLMFRELFGLHYMQTDPNPGNYLYQPDTGKIVLLDFGSTLELEPGRVERYRGICRALMKDDAAGIRRYAVELGYLAEDEPEPRGSGVIEMIRLVCEPLTHRGAYDFAGSRLVARARDLGIDLALRHGLPAPPPETAFLHRKLVGNFMLCAMLRAHIDAHALIMPWLRKQP
jgi:predicted unusual protein kinase regulating ubiquinone biosynthesis (AarF/ABC1/UbiB family)